MGIAIQEVYKRWFQLFIYFIADAHGEKVENIPDNIAVCMGVLEYFIGGEIEISSRKVLIDLLNG